MLHHVRPGDILSDRQGCFCDSRVLEEFHREKIDSGQARLPSLRVYRVQVERRKRTNWAYGILADDAYYGRVNVSGSTVEAHNFSLALRAFGASR